MPLGGKNFKDVALFGRVLSTGVLIAGYAFGGVYIARWLEGKGFPSLLVTLTPFLVALFGLWQGWLYIKQIGAGRNGKKKKK